MSAIHQLSSLSSPDEITEPSKLTAQQLEVLQALARGQTVTAAAAAAGLHRTTIHHWCRTKPGFQAMLDRARQFRAAVLRDELFDLAGDALSVVRQCLGDADLSPTVRLRAALTVLQGVAAVPPPPREYQ